MLRFFDGANEARDSLTHRYTLVRGSAAMALRASSEGYLRLGVQAQVRREDFRPEGSVVPFEKTITGAVGPYVTWSRTRFLVTRGYAGFAREEDVDLGLTVRAGLMVAPAAFGYERDGIAPLTSARLGVRVPGGFGYLEALAGGLYDASGLDSGSVQLAATAVLQPGPNQVGILHLEGGWLKDPVPGAEFDLGLGTGPRAFRSHSFTGDRSYFGTAEYRVTVVDDFLGQIGLGIAGFVDHGGAWYAGERAAERLGRRHRSPSGRQPLHRHRRPALRLRAPLRERRAGRRVGRHGGQGVRLLASGAPAAIIGRPQPSRP